MKLTSKYIIGEGEGGVSQFFLRLQSYSYGNMPNFKIIAYLLLGCTGFFKGSDYILLVTQDHMQSFKFVAYLLLVYFWLV